MKCCICNQETPKEQIHVQDAVVGENHTSQIIYVYCRTCVKTHRESQFDPAFPHREDFSVPKARYGLRESEG